MSARSVTFLGSYILGLGVSVCPAQSLQFSAVPPEVVETRLRAYTARNEKREPAVRDLFEDAGCGAEHLTEQPVKGSKAPNLICTLSGATGEVIVVGAHFDLIEKGKGVADNWSGASLLASLYQGLAGVPRRHTFRFVAFAAEEAGMLGSKAYVREAIRTQEPIVSMVNMDTLGLTESEVWVSRADPRLLRLLGQVAGAMKLPVTGMNVDQVGSTDSESFRDKKIPAITIHSLTSSTLPILHSVRDQIGVIDQGKYYRSYQLVLAYLALLDQSL